MHLNKDYLWHNLSPSYLTSKNFFMSGKEYKTPREQDENQSHVDEELTKITPETNDVATNTGTTIDTLDAAFHNALGISKGNELTGSNRADYYESNAYGKSDAEEELDNFLPDNMDDKKD